MSINPKIRYKNLDNRVIEPMQRLYSIVQDRYTLSDEYILTLDMIANNYNLYYQAKDIIDKDGLITDDKRGSEKAHPLLTPMQHAQDKILQLIKQYGLTPMSKSRIKRNDDENAVQELINSLTS